MLYEKKAEKKSVHFRKCIDFFETAIWEIMENEDILVHSKKTGFFVKLFLKISLDFTECERISAKSEI